MKKRKILFHINSLGKGGAERVVSVLSKYFAQDGYEVVIATLWRADQEYELSEKVRRINFDDEKKERGRLGTALGRFTDLRVLIRKEKPDIVISFCNKANFRSAYSMVGMKIPLLVSVRNDPKKDYAPYKKATAYMEKKAAGCVFQTPDAREFFAPELQEKSKLIYNPIDEKYFANDREEKPSDKRIVTVGRLSVQKNQMLLLKAFARLHEEFPDIELCIYGEESDENIKAALLAFVEQAGLIKKIKFMGQSDHLDEELQGAALFVLSSDYEGMPNALMEAMALGIPVISTDCPCGGSRMLIEDGISGMLVPVGDEDRLARAMSQMLSDKESAQRMGKCAKQIREKAAPQKVYQEWKAYVNELIK